MTENRKHHSPHVEKICNAHRLYNVVFAAKKAATTARNSCLCCWTLFDFSFFFWSSSRIVFASLSQLNHSFNFVSPRVLVSAPCPKPLAFLDFWFLRFDIPFFTQCLWVFISAKTMIWRKKVKYRQNKHIFQVYRSWLLLLLFARSFFQTFFSGFFPCVVERWKNKIFCCSSCFFVVVVGYYVLYTFLVYPLCLSSHTTIRSSCPRLAFIKG